MEENKKDLETSEVVEQNKENVIPEETKVEVQVGEKKKGILIRLIASMIDQTVAIGVSVGLLFLFDGILRLFGLFVAQRQPIFFIIFVIVNVIYSPIMESTKVKATLGRKLLKL